MKIKVGLVAPSPGWEQLLAQEGIPYSILDAHDWEDIANYSVLAVNRTLSDHEKEIAGGYLKKGGAVIGSTEHLLHVCGIDGTEQRIEYITSNHEDVFPSIRLLDVGVTGLIPRGANCCRTNDNTFAIAVEELGSGYAVVMPFDAGALLNDPRPASKNFYFTTDRLPSERVSLVAKGEVWHLVHAALQHLHHIRNIPYFHLWYFPADQRNVFAFRIDSDGASRQDIDKLYHMGLERDIAMSWYLDVKSHEEWLDHFRYFVGQEIGLHCYEHQTYPTYAANQKNISKGLHEMHRVGLDPSGFTAPYGRWNSHLAKAIDDAGFEYSSEFSFAYDTLPLTPATAEHKFVSLQIPIHPICIGSLAKAGFSDARMFEYFVTVTNWKLSRNEPLFFYHHPSHRHWDAVSWLLNLKPKGIESMTFGEYARWWKRRLGFNYDLDYDGSTLTIQTAHDKVPDDVYIRIANPRGDEAILPIAKRIELASVLRWEVREKPAVPPGDIRRAREFDPRQMLGGMYDMLVRKFR